MKSLGKKEAFVLVIGDLIALFLALWVSLFLRYGAVPGADLLSSHLSVFSVIFIIWIIVYSIAGLYDKLNFFSERKFSRGLIRAQIINSALAVAFFYIVPSIAITPKIVLFIYVVVSFIFLYLWRELLVTRLPLHRKQRALLIASGEEMQQFQDEMNNNPRYGIVCAASINLDEANPEELQRDIASLIERDQVQLVIVDLYHEKAQAMISSLYTFLFSQVVFVNFHQFYEVVFNRIPLSIVTHSWFMENISPRSKETYDVLKRAMDIVVSVLLGIITLPISLVAAVAIKWQDGGDIFFTQDRIGKNNAIFRNIKFRTMSPHKEVDGLSKNSVVTRVGNFLRKTRIDELPQIINVLRGDLSLIGPRPEVPVLVKQYEQEVPYYRVRHLLKPGLSGWAQLYQKDPPKVSADAQKTRIKLSYDLYYIKNRSFILDLRIALKTIAILLSRSGE
jgi:exopolysaccharide biosynthesis polyprenyl glycosylphosphotransferase